MTQTMTYTAPESRVFAGVQLREVETTDSLSMMRGLALPYDEWASIGWFMERFLAGSVAKSISEAKAKGRDLPINLFHKDRWWPIGAANEWQETARGLVGIWRLDDSELAQNAARLAKPVADGGPGMLQGLSIEFSAIRSEWDNVPYDEWNPDLGPDHMDKVTRIEARLGAVGLVQTPAYVSAGVDLVRSADARQRRERRAAAGTPVLDAMRARTDALRGGASS